MSTSCFSKVQKLGPCPIASNFFLDVGLFGKKRGLTSFYRWIQWTGKEIGVLRQDPGGLSRGVVFENFRRIRASAPKKVAVPLYSAKTSLLFTKLPSSNSFQTTINYLQRHFTITSNKMSQQSTPNGSICRQNYHEESEANINKQINMELYASYVYMSMAYYFDREDVALHGFYKYFKKASDEEREHAEKFMKYQNKRGGRIVLQPIAKPTRDEWSGPLEAITAALELEKTVNQTLLDLHGVSSRNGDPHLSDFLETEFLEEQVKSIKELAGHVTNLNRVGQGLGEYTYDRELGESTD